MKTVLGSVLFALTFVSINAFAQSNSAPCRLGEMTYQWTDKSDLLGVRKYKVTSIEDVVFTKNLKTAVVETVYQLIDSTHIEDKSRPSFEVALEYIKEQFLGGDITTFQLADTGERFLAISTYPGDNEYGLIFKVKHNGQQQELQKVALITDSEIECNAKFKK